MVFLVGRSRPSHVTITSPPIQFSSDLEKVCVSFWYQTGFETSRRHDRIQLTISDGRRYQEPLFNVSLVV